MLLQNDEKNFQNDGVVLIYHEKIDFLSSSNLAILSHPNKATDNSTPEWDF